MTMKTCVMIPNPTMERKNDCVDNDDNLLAITTWFEVAMLDER